ncbi:MAG: hypothetical protein QW483_00600 [Nanopusillaceae archaeon]
MVAIRKMDPYKRKRLGIKEGPLEKTVAKIVDELVENPIIKAKFREWKKELTVKSKYLFAGKAFLVGVFMYYFGGRLEIDDVYTLKEARLKAAKTFAESTLKNKILKELVYSWQRYVAPKSLHPKKRTIIRSPEDLDYIALYEYFRRGLNFDRYAELGFLTIDLQENKVIIESTPLCNEIVLEYLPEITRIYDEEAVSDFVKEHERTMHTLEAIGMESRKEEKLDNSEGDLNKSMEEVEEDIENE